MRNAIIGGLVALGLAFTGCRDEETGGAGAAGSADNVQPKGSVPASEDSYGTPGFTPSQTAGPRAQAPGGSPEGGPVQGQTGQPQGQDEQPQNEAAPQEASPPAGDERFERDMGGSGGGGG